MKSKIKDADLRGIYVGKNLAFLHSTGMRTSVLLNTITLLTIFMIRYSMITNIHFRNENISVAKHYYVTYNIYDTIQYDN